MTNNTVDIDGGLRRIKGREPRTQSIATRFTRSEEQVLQKRLKQPARVSVNSPSMLSRAGKNFALDRQTEPLVLPSEVSGLDDLRGFLKYGNHVARFSFPFVALREKNPGLDERKMDDLIIPSTRLPQEPEELQANCSPPWCKPCLRSVL
jgi:hypothetical protein